MAPSSTPRSLREKPLATEWQPRGQSVAAGQTGLLFSDAGVRREHITSGVYRVRENAVAAAGGADRLVAMLDREPSYLATVSKCLNRTAGDRHFPIDWDAALLLEREPAAALIHGYAELAGVEVVIKERVDVAPEDMGKAALDVLRELGRIGINTGELLNRKLGVKPGTVKL